MHCGNARAGEECHVMHDDACMREQKLAGGGRGSGGALGWLCVLACTHSGGELWILACACAALRRLVAAALALLLARVLTVIHRRVCVHGCAWHGEWGGGGVCCGNVVHLCAARGGGRIRWGLRGRGV